MDVRGRDHNKASSSLIGASAIHGRSSQLPRPITVDVAGGQDDRLPMGAIVEALMRLEWTATAGEVLDQYTAQMEGRALNSLISSLGKRHRPWLSLRVFRWAQVARPELVNRIHHNNLISIMGRHKQYGAALQVFEELRQRSGGCLQEEGDGGGPDAFSYTAVITACAYAGKWQTAAHWFRHMEEERLRPNRYTYNALLCAYEKGGQWEQAEAVLQEMIKIGGSAAPDAVSYNSVMAACNRGGQRIQALKVAAAMASAGLDADTVTFNTLIDVHGREGSWVEARRLVKEMKERGVGRDTVTYTSAIVACGRAKQAAAALEVFEEMAMDGVAPNTFTYNALITALTRGEMWERALALSSSMAPASISGQAIPASSTSGRQPRRDAITYTALITACAAGGQAAKAAALLEEMRSAGIPRTVTVYTALIGAYGASGRHWRCAEEAWRAMQREGLRPDRVAHNTMIATLRDCGQCRRAMQVWREMKAAQIAPDVVTYNTLISVHGRAGQWWEAQALADEMISVGVTPDEVTYTSLLVALADADQTAEAVAVLKGMHCRWGLSLTASTAAIVMRACARSGAAGHAQMVLRTMAKEGVPLDGSILSSALTAWKNAGLLGEGVTVLLGELVDRRTPLDEALFPTLFCICLHMEMQDHHELAKLLAKEVQHAGEGPDSELYSLLVMVYAKCKGRDGARALASESEG